MNLLHINDKRGVHAPSWYADTCGTTAQSPLETHVSTDVCIIGAGFTGLSAALELQSNGIDCVLLEAHQVGWGASGRNGGQLGTGFNMDQTALESLVGRVQAHKLWNIAESAKRWIKDTCHHYQVDIEYQPGIVYALHRQRFVKPLHQYCEYLHKQYDYTAMQALDAEQIQRRVACPSYFGGAIDHGAGHVHPLKLAQGLAHAALKCGARLYEQSEVVRLERKSTTEQRVITPTGSVSCQHVILATNGYGDNLDRHLQTRLMPINNFIVVTEPLGALAEQLLPFNEAVADSRFVVNYFRRVAGDRLLFGGGENYSYRFPKHIVPLVRKAMLGIFPDVHSAAIDYAWGGTLAITRNRLPYIRELEPQRFTAGGYSGHGVALACIYGKALAGKLYGDDETFTDLSCLPDRRFPGGVRSRPYILAAAMTAYSWMDKL